MSSTPSSLLLFESQWLLITLFSMMCSRAISGPFNFILNWLFVFPSKNGKWRKTWRYLLLFITSLACSFGLTVFFQYLGSIVAPWLVTIIKWLVDFFIAVCNFLINTLWVFAKRHLPKKKAKD